MIKHLLIAACATGAFAGERAAACATVSFTQPATITTWNPITGPAVEVTFTATIVRGPSNVRGARLILVDADAAATTRYAQTGPIYQITNNGVPISFKSGTTASTSGVGITDIPNGSGGNNVAVPLKIVVLANGSDDFLGGASFTETLSYSIQCLDNKNDPVGSPNPNSAPAFSPTITIPRFVSLTSASAATINFGTFTTTMQEALVTLKSTSSINVAISTLNGNRMIRSGASNPTANEIIAYGLTFDSVTIPTTGTTLNNQPRAGVLGATRRLTLTLPGLPSGKLAGSYRDVISLSVTPGV